MTEVILKEGESLEQALKKFQRISASKKRRIKDKRAYLKPGVRKRLKAKLARKKAAKRKRKRF